MLIGMLAGVAVLVVVWWTGAHRVYVVRAPRRVGDGPGRIGGHFVAPGPTGARPRPRRAEPATPDYHVEMSAEASERETLDVDVLIVGGGPAGLSAALRLSQLQKAEGGEPLSIAVLDKAREPGAHMLSGAVLDPHALATSFPTMSRLRARRSRRRSRAMPSTS